MDKQATGSTIAIPIKVLDSLCSRFLLNLPPQERNDNIRVMFQIELAHWFYIDFYRVEMQGLPGCGIKDFAKIIFNHCPFLNDHAPNAEKIYAEWREYKMSVPTYGAIMLDETLQHIVMVQSFFSKTSWGFPKGKVNEGEEPHQCAVREVREETGYDISSLIVENDYIETTFNEQLARLYIVPKVPMEAKFEPQTRGEIRDVKWFHIDDLPSHKKDMAPKQNLGLNPNNFFMAIPFIKPLKKKINKRRGKSNQEDRDSPLAAIKNSLANNQQQQQQHQIQQIPHQQPNNKPNANNVDPKHKQRQQRAFAQQNQSELSQYLKYKDPSMADPNAGNAIGRPQLIPGMPNQYQQQQKGRGRNSNPSTPQKPIQILTRNGKIGGRSAFTSLETDSVAVQPPPSISRGSHPQVINSSILYSKTFMNFRFNMADTMKAFEGF